MLRGYCTRKLVCVNDEWFGFFNLGMHTWRTLIPWNTHIVGFIYKLTIRATATWFTNSNTYLIWLRTCGRAGFTLLKYLTTDWTWCTCKNVRGNIYLSFREEFWWHKLKFTGWWACWTTLANIRICWGRVLTCYWLTVH